MPAFRCSTQSVFAGCRVKVTFGPLPTKEGLKTPVRGLYRVAVKVAGRPVTV